MIPAWPNNASWVTSGVAAAAVCDAAAAGRRVSGRR